MSVLFVGTSISDFAIANSPIETTAAVNIGPYVKEGAAVGGTTAKSLTCDFAAQSDLWMSWYHRVLSTTSGTAVTCAEFYSTGYSTVNALFRIRRPNATTWRLEYYNGSAWVTTEATWADGPGADTSLHKFDVHLKLSNTVGEFTVYKDGVLKASFSLSDTIWTAATAVDRATLYAGGYISSTTDAFLSAVIVADEDTKSMNLSQMKPTGAGSASEWTGTYADIDETGIGDADFIESLSANQISTFAFEDMPTAVVTHNVIAVAVAGRGRVGTGSPSDIEAISRISGSNFSSDIGPVGTGYGPFQSIMHLNPSSGGQWTKTSVDAAEFGLKSLT